MERRVVLFGATGRSGRLIAGELADLGARTLLVGRRRPAVEAVAAATGHAWAVADTTTLPSHLVAGDVLLSCVGPYDLHGDPVAGHAHELGLTYLDVTGEPAFLARLHARFGGPAATRATFLPAVGYDFVPGLIAAELALADAGAAARSVVVSYFAFGGLEAGGAAAQASVLRALTRATMTFSAGRHHRERAGRRVRTLECFGARRTTMSLGGLEVWALPRRHPGVDAVDVHTGWFGQRTRAIAALAVATNAPTPARRLVTLLGRAASTGPDEALAGGVSRVVAEVLDRDGTTLARTELSSGNAIVLAARLAAWHTTEAARRDREALPVGVTDPIAAFGLARVLEGAAWAGLVPL